MEETLALILSVFWSSTHPDVLFLSIIRKNMISLLPHKMKSRNKTLYPSLSRIWNMSGSTKETAFWWKNGHVAITWHAVVPCEHSNFRQVHDHHFSRRFGALQWKKMKFEVNFCLSLVSMLSAISWYKAPFISLAVPQFGTT